MKKFLSSILAVALLATMLSVSTVTVSASSENEYARGILRTGVYYSDSRTKEALDKCKLYASENAADSLVFDLQGATLDIYDDLFIDKSGVFYFSNGTIRCNNCRAFNLEEDDVILYLQNIYVENGLPNCSDDDDNAYGGAIYVDGADCVIDGTYSNGVTNGKSTICDCSSKYGGAIAVFGHDCTIRGIRFKSNNATFSINGGDDLYINYEICRVENCEFDKTSGKISVYINDAKTEFKNCNITKKMCIGDVGLASGLGTLFSDGNWWIIAVAGGVALITAGVFIFLHFKKKRKGSE